MGKKSRKHHFGEPYGAKIEMMYAATIFSSSRDKILKKKQTT